MLDRDAFPQFRSPQRGQLSLAQFPEQAFIRMDGHAPSVQAVGTALAQRAGCTRRTREMDDPTRDEGHLHLIGTEDNLVLPVQVKGCFGKPIPIADGPGFGSQISRSGRLSCTSRLLKSARSMCNSLNW